MQDIFCARATDSNMLALHIAHSQGRGAMSRGNVGRKITLVQFKQSIALDMFHTCSNEKSLRCCLNDLLENLSDLQFLKYQPDRLAALIDSQFYFNP